MVYFVCSTCGTCMKKNQVGTHWFKCRGSRNVSCMDCGKDFWWVFAVSLPARPPRGSSFRSYSHYRDGHGPAGAFTCPLRSRSAHGPIISYPRIPPQQQWVYDHHWRRMCDFSPAELAVIAIALDEEERKQSRKRKGVLVHPILQDKKKSEGEFHTLFPRLIDD